MRRAQFFFVLLVYTNLGFVQLQFFSNWPLYLGSLCTRALFTIPALINTLFTPTQSSLRCTASSYCTQLKFHIICILHTLNSTSHTCQCYCIHLIPWQLSQYQLHHSCKHCLSSSHQPKATPHRYAPTAPCSSSNCSLHDSHTRSPRQPDWAKHHPPWVLAAAMTVSTGSKLPNSLIFTNTTGVLPLSMTTCSGSSPTSAPRA